MLYVSLPLRVSGSVIRLDCHHVCLYTVVYQQSR